MDAALERDGRCQRCGTLEQLTVHFIPGGEHSANADDYEVLCRYHHGQVDGPRAHERRGR